MPVILQNPDQRFLAAAEEGDNVKLSAALKTGASLDARDERGRTALHVAVAAGKLDTVKYLTKTIENMNIEARDKNENTPLLTAFEYGQPEIAEYLIHECHAKTDVVDKKQHGILRKSAKNRTDVGDKLTRLAVEAGDALDKVDGEGFTALHTMVEMGNLSGMEYALVAGANPRLSGKGTQTPYEIAESDGLKAEAAMLLQFIALPKVPDDLSNLTYDELVAPTETSGYRMLDNPILWRRMPEVIATLEAKGEKLPGKEELSIEGVSTYVDLSQIRPGTYSPMALSLYTGAWDSVEYLMAANGEELEPKDFWDPERTAIGSFGKAAIDKGFVRQLFSEENWRGQSPDAFSHFYKEMPEEVQDSIPNYNQLLTEVRAVYRDLSQQQSGMAKG